MGAMQVLKFGPGLVGRTAPIPIAFSVVILAAIAACRDYPHLVVLFVFTLLVGMAAYIWTMTQHAKSNPNAVMEGATVVAYKKLEIEQATRDSGPIIDGTATPVPNTDPPAAIAAGPNP